MTGLMVAVSVVLLIGLAALVALALYRRNVHIWLPDFLAGNRQQVQGRPVHVVFCFVDHFEPMWGRADYATEKERVARWQQEYPRLAARHADAEGRPPQHTFFYPQEEYRPEHLEALAQLCRQGLGEVEVHLHHDRDTAEGLRRKLSGFLEQLDQGHGLVPRHPDGRYAWSFIHGNWALDNSRRDGRWCGVDNELSVLAEQGCYADFTLPSAPSDTQTRFVNRIYYASGRDGHSKSHNTGEVVQAGRAGRGDLMIIQGPLLFNWKRRKLGFFPRIENSDIRRSQPPSPERVDLWVDAGIAVPGRPDWLFIKIHTHGTQDGDMDVLLGEPMDRTFSYLESRYNDGERYQLHYVTAREMYNIVRAAEAGKSGNPAAYRDFVIPRAPGLDAGSAGTLEE